MFPVGDWFIASSLDASELYAFKGQYDRRHQCGDEYVSALLIFGSSIPERQLRLRLAHIRSKSVRSVTGRPCR
jgi:hypothetical protein